MTAVLALLGVVALAFLAFLAWIAWTCCAAAPWLDEQAGYEAGLPTLSELRRRARRG